MYLENKDRAQFYRGIYSLITYANGKRICKNLDN